MEKPMCQELREALANSQQGTKALSPATHNELNLTPNHINKLRREPSEETLALANN